MAMQMIKADIIVIGAGASGLAAAISAKQCSPELDVIVLERNPKIGKKLLVTGSGRCNLGNVARSGDAYHGSLTELLPLIISKTQDSEAFFWNMGLYCRHEDEGRIYPYTNQAKTVVDTLCHMAEQLNIPLYCESTACDIRFKDNRFEIDSENDTFSASAIIVATGGFAAPRTGSDGNTFALLPMLGHKFTPPKPALIPYYTDVRIVEPLKGIRIPAKVSLLSEQEEVLAEDTGEVQFTLQTISGICVMNASVRCEKEEEPAFISLRLLPELSSQQMENFFWDMYALRSTWKLERFLSGIFHKKIGMRLIRDSGIKLRFSEPVHMITPQQMQMLLQTCQDWRFPILSRGKWRDAQVTAGGIPLHEVDDLLQSKFTPGLFFAGEVLDLHGECGGYNLNWAWESGQYAGQNAAKLVQEQQKGASLLD